MPVAKHEAVGLVTKAAQAVRSDAVVWAVVRVLTFASLTALAAQVCIPVGRVPITLQTLAVLLTGFWLRPREAAAALGLYLTVGALGAPVFSLGAWGLGGATMGYLLGFVPAAWAISVLAHGRSDCLWRLVLAAGVGLAVIYAAGLLWLSTFPGGLKLALADGFVVFLGIAALKAAVAVAAVRAGATVTGRAGRARTAEADNE